MRQPDRKRLVEMFRLKAETSRINATFGPVAEVGDEIYFKIRAEAFDEVARLIAAGEDWTFDEGWDGV